jgi:glucokinase
MTDGATPTEPVGRLPADAVVLALDLGASQVRTAAVLPDGALVGRRSTATPQGTGPDEIFAACADLISSLRDDLPPDLRARAVAIGISSMGPVDPWRGTVVDPPNVPAFRDAPLADEVEVRVGLPAFLDRDTNVAALAERWLGAARGCAHFIYVTVSTGLGGAIVRDGKLLFGPDGCAGELGHTCLMPVDGPLCGCGGTGHLEAISSGSGLAAQARRIVETGKMSRAAAWSLDWSGEADPSLATPAGPAVSPFLSARAASGLLTGRDVAEGEEAGDPICRIIMLRARRAFAIACVGWVDAFNPETIVVGGTVAEKQGERWLAPARDEVARTAFSAPARRVRIEAAALGGDVGLVGAWPLVADRFGVAEWQRGRAAAAPLKRGGDSLRGGGPSA